MTSIDHYLNASTRANTQRSYQASIEHFEVTWGGFLPATADSIAQYLVDHANTLSINTLKNRLSGLAQWHKDQGFPDPTKAPVVKKVLKGIKELHPMIEKQARPLELDMLNVIITSIEKRQYDALQRNDSNCAIKLARNKAMVLIGFWRGFRSDELSRLKIEHIQVSSGKGMEIFLPASKGDRQNNGRRFKTPALSYLCPVDAYQEWINASNFQFGPVFRRIDRWGNISQKPINSNSISVLLRSIIAESGIDDSHHFSSHSLRRGFASWANQHEWDIKSLMEYVGWKDMKSAMRYIDTIDNYAKHKIEAVFHNQKNK